MKRTLYGVLAGLALAVCGCGPAGASGDAAGGATTIQHVDPAGAEKLVTEKKVVVIDVRTPKEFAAGHIKGAKLIDFTGADFAGKLGELDRNQEYLVHCATGGRSTKSLAVFKKLGFKEVAHLDGGFEAWKAAGEPVEK